MTTGRGAGIGCAAGNGCGMKAGCCWIKKFGLGRESLGISWTRTG